ncbi:f674fb83-23b0-43b3-a18f-8c6045a6d6f0 [Thermothielavioides terrestris]|uniref:F674fb83-23b0-43b3-a18f-8c6045a6d6f0 n=1 Tax=Thermothielavioides terrestris TaxID=2587410 RepID=A0A3S4C8Y3_9PEZI|nr:f674fb83-23b0-43b3-a18f-8c6045a6d6f0 [Thermothielavioides terrestris]
MPSEIKDKNAEPINEGDHVFARSRGGRHEGEVEKIVTSKEEAEKEGVKHPPKVLFTDQHGHKIEHNPGVLQHGEYKQK